MEFWSHIFSFVCGQGRCFVIDGTALPVCQRCCGLYVGAAAAAIWLGVTGLWRRGLPNRMVFVLQVGMLAAAMLGGLHAMDLGPRWRLLCGLWTGQVATSWLIGGWRHLRTLSRADGRQMPWRNLDDLLAFSGALAMVGLAGAFDQVLGLGRTFWVACIVLGAIVLLASAGASIHGASIHSFKWIHRWIDAAPRAPDARAPDARTGATLPIDFDD